MPGVPRQRRWEGEDLMIRTAPQSSRRPVDAAIAAIAAVAAVAAG